YVGKGIGFDCVHAAGCLVFALALGPALNRSLSRFATRLDVTWRAAAVNPLVDAVDADAVDADAVHANAVRARILLGVILVSGAWLAGQPGPVGGEFGLARAAGTPAGYLRAAQNPDGGI